MKYISNMDGKKKRIKKAIQNFLLEQKKSKLKQFQLVKESKEVPHHHLLSKI